MDMNYISEKAKEIRIKYGFIGTAVDPVVIAEENSINIVQKSNLNIKGEPVSGAIIKSDSDIIIYLNAEDSKNRKRFTVAHELAHYFLHLDKDKQLVDFRRSNNNQDEKELEADEFAGCLLMDKDLIEEWYNKSKKIRLDDEKIIEVLSKIFVVSNSAICIRLKNLGLLK